jgi:hypothetical protein
MSRGAMIALIAGAIAVAAIAGVIASISPPPVPSDGNSTDVETGGRQISINLDENLGLKENS